MIHQKIKGGPKDGMRKRKWNLAAVAVLLCCLFLCGTAAADEAEPAVTLAEKQANLTVGDSLQLHAEAADGQELVYTSLTKDVATVDDTGKITGVGEGKGTVKVALADGSASAICKVSVTMPFPAYSLREGETLQLEAPFAAAEWTSSHPDVVRVDPAGKVTGLAFGRSYVTATNGLQQVTYTISVGAHIGIDVSHWNEAVDWQALKEQGVEFAMLRVGYGESDVDKKFIQNIEGAIANDFPIGVYYYSYAKDTAKAKREAANCLRLLEPYKDELALPVVYDVEEYKDLDGKTLVDIMTVFGDEMQKAGLNAMFYSNGSFFSKMDLTGLTDMGIDYWYAWYQTVPDHSIVHTIYGKTQAMMWQYSDSGVVQGALASGRTDLNVLYMPEYLEFTAPKLKATATVNGASLRWGGSAYAGSYTVYRVGADGKAAKVGSYGGGVHMMEDTEFRPGDGYYVTMEICDPIDGTGYRSYTSHVIHPEVELAMHEVQVKATEGGKAAGGGVFAEGTQITVTAAPAADFVFKGWFDAAGKQLSADAEYRFTVKQPVVLQARFEKKPEEVIPPEPDRTFTDVKPTDWFADSVTYVVENGLFSGTSPTTFSPQGTMTRGMLVTVLYREAGSPAASNHNRFNDVPADAWYARAVTWAYNNGIVTGTASKLFSPNDPVTREQMATILMRYSQKMGMEVPLTTEGDLTAFADADQVSGFAKDAMEWAVSAQLIGGANGKLNPRGAATRAECATILMRWLESVAEQ